MMTKQAKEKSTAKRAPRVMAVFDEMQAGSVMDLPGQRASTAEANGKLPAKAAKLAKTDRVVKNGMVNGYVVKDGVVKGRGYVVKDGVVKVREKKQPEARPRGRPAINPVRVCPTIKAKDLLSRERLSNGIDMRPVIWQDLPNFASDHSRSSMEMMYDLGFNTTYQYTSAAKKAEVVPFDVELLLRIYRQYPSSCAWIKPTPAQALELLYGDLIEPYRGNEDAEASIRMALGSRFAAYLDRSVTVLYRWLTDKGASSRRVVNIMSKMEEMGDTPLDRRKEFERIANQAWKFRGVDMEYAFPLPTQPGNPRYMKDWVRASVIEVGDLSNKTYHPGTFG